MFSDQNGIKLEINKYASDRFFLSEHSRTLTSIDQTCRQRQNWNFPEKWEFGKTCIYHCDILYFVSDSTLQLTSKKDYLSSFSIISKKNIQNSLKRQLKYFSLFKIMYMRLNFFIHFKYCNIEGRSRCVNSIVFHEARHWRKL